MEDLKFSKLRVIADRGLREGLLIDSLSRSGHARLVRGLSMRQRGVLQLGRACGFDEIHGKHVAQLALELFDSAERIGLHRLGAHERELLEHAAQLHDIGTFPIIIITCTPPISFAMPNCWDSISPRLA